jgi:hypothetical protein
MDQNTELVLRAKSHSNSDIEGALSAASRAVARFERSPLNNGFGVMALTEAWNQVFQRLTGQLSEVSRQHALLLNGVLTRELPNRLLQAADLGSRVGIFADRVTGLSGVFTEAARDAMERWARESAPGTFLGDVLTAVGGEASASEQLAALDRLSENWFRSPLHPARFVQAQSELHARALDNGTTLRQEMKISVRQSLPLVLKEHFDGTPVPDLLRACRASLANYVMDDLAGPGWRQRSRGIVQSLDRAHEDVERDLSSQYEMQLMELQLSFWAAVADLPRAQRDALVARVFSDRPLRNAEHQAVHRARSASSMRSLLKDVS